MARQMKTILDHGLRIWWDATDKPALFVGAALWVPVMALAIFGLFNLVHG